MKRAHDAISREWVGVVIQSPFPTSKIDQKAQVNVIKSSPDTGRPF